MGNQCGNQEQVLDLEKLVKEKFKLKKKDKDKQLNQINIFAHVDVNNHHIIATWLKQIQNQQQLAIKKYQLSLQQSISHTNLIKLYHWVENKKGKMCCSCCPNNICFAFQFYHLALSDKIKEYSQRKVSLFYQIDFKQNQIIKLIQQISGALICLHANNLYLTNLNSYSIKFTHNKIKLLNYNILHDRSIMQSFKKNLGFPSPQQLKDKNNNKVPQPSQKSDVYALGMIGLQMALLYSMRNNYCYRNNQFEVDIKDELKKCEQYYSQTLSNLLRKLLEEDENKRPSSSEVNQMCHAITSSHNFLSSIIYQQENNNDFEKSQITTIRMLRPVQFSMLKNLLNHQTSQNNLQRK